MIDVHGKAVDEVADSRLGLRLSVVGLRWEIVGWNAEGLLKIGAFFRLGFEIVQVEMAEDEIEHGEASLDIFHFVLAPVAEVWSFEMPVELPGENVIDDAVLGEAFGPGAFAGLEFGPEQRRALAPMRAGERQKLAGHEVARMRGHEIEEVGLLRRVSEGLRGFDEPGKRS